MVFSVYVAFTTYPKADRVCDEERFCCLPACAPASHQPTRTNQPTNVQRSRPTRARHEKNLYYSEKVRCKGELALELHVYSYQTSNYCLVAIEAAAKYVVLAKSAGSGAGPSPRARAAGVVTSGDRAPCQQQAHARPP